MKAVIVFLLIALGGIGFVLFDNWLVSEPPPHVFRVNTAAKSK